MMALGSVGADNEPAVGLKNNVCKAKQTLSTDSGIADDFRENDTENGKNY